MPEFGLANIYAPKVEYVPIYIMHLWYSLYLYFPDDLIVDEEEGADVQVFQPDAN